MATPRFVNLTRLYTLVCFKQSDRWGGSVTLDTLAGERLGASVAPTAALASFAAGIAYRQLPAETAETAKRLLLDGTGCLLNGTQGDPGRIAWRTIERYGYGIGPSTAIISGEKISPRDAAFVNGITLY